MEKHIVTKPSIQFLNYDSDALLITDTGGILTGLTDNPHYLTPSPALAPVQTALDEFITSVSDSVNGGVTLTSIKNGIGGVAAPTGGLCAGNLQG